MRIGILTDSYYKSAAEPIDGVSSAVFTLARGLRKAGQDVTVMGPYPPCDVKLPKLPFKLFGKYNVAIAPPKSSYDVVHSHGLNPIHTMVKGPKVHTFHTLVQEARPHYAPWLPFGLMKKYMQWFLSHFDIVTFVSDYTKRRVVNEFDVEGDFRVVHLGIEVERFLNATPDLAREKYNLPEKFILFVGRMVPEKKIRLLKGIDMPLVFAGKGPVAEEVKKWPNAQYLGFVSGDLLPSLMAAAQALVLPNYFDTLGLVVLEAMAAGTPSVVPVNSAQHEVAGPYAITFEFGSGEAETRENLAEALHRAMAQKKNSAALKNYVQKNFSVERMIKDFIKIYEELV